MRQFWFRLWQFLSRHPMLFLGMALAFEALAAYMLGHGKPLDHAFLQFELGIQQILATHHIQSTFLPIGYAALIGYIQLLGTTIAPARPEVLVFPLQIAILLGILALARAILKRYTSAAYATAAALVISLNPALLYNANRITDANVTFLLLLALLFTLLRLRQSNDAWNACFFGLVLACSVAVRPNLVLMLPLLLWAGRGSRLPRAGFLVLSACGTALLLYAAVTTVVHRRPFYPENGPYNFFAGYNPRTESALLRVGNGEQSIVQAMNDLGQHPTLDWGRQSDQPGVDDIRDERYIPLYKSESRSFLRQHVLSVPKLIAVKFWTFMLPLEANVDHSSVIFHRFRTAIKFLTLLGMAVWAIFLLLSAARNLHLGNPPVIWMAILYLLPFILINADPRFRTALEGILFLDLARMVYILRKRANGSFGNLAQVL